jgi:hypothetical protein
MVKNGNTDSAVDQMRKKVNDLKEQIRALETAIALMERPEAPTIAPPSSDYEFATKTIPEATEVLIKRARKPLHVVAIVKGLKDGGFHFRTKTPKKTVPGALLGAIKLRKTSVQAIGKNTFSLPEITG